MLYKINFHNVIHKIFVLAFISILVVTNGCKKSGSSESAGSNDSIDPTAKLIEDVNVTEKIDLTILYAGLLDTDRAKDFTDFLSKHFTEVKTTDYMKFTGMESTPFDVAIIDHNGLGFNAPLPNISQQYSHATITVGVPGAFLCSRLNLKTGYL